MLLKELLKEKKRNNEWELMQVFKWFQRDDEAWDWELLNEIRWHNAKIFTEKFLRRERFIKEGETKNYPLLWLNIIFEVEAAYRILDEGWEKVFFDAFIFPDEEEDSADIHLYSIWDYPPFNVEEVEKIPIYPLMEEQKLKTDGIRLINVLDYLWGINRLKEGGRFIFGFYRDREFRNKWVMYLRPVEEGNREKIEVPDRVEDFLQQYFKEF